jgi:DNA polymerase-3 subunit alpha
MVFVQFEDSTGKIEVVVFPKTYQEYNNIIQENNILTIHGKISDKEGSYKLIADKITIFEPNNLPKIQAILLIVPNKIKKELFVQLKDLINKNQGDLPVLLQVGNKKIDTNMKSNTDIIDKLKKLFGTNSVSLL